MTQYNIIITFLCFWDRAVELYTRAQRPGFDMRLRLPESPGTTVVWGSGVVGVDVPGGTDGVGKRDGAVALPAADFEDVGAGGDVPVGDELEAVGHLADCDGGWGVGGIGLEVFCEVDCFGVEVGHDG